MINLLNIALAFIKANRLKVLACLAIVGVVFAAYKFGHYQGQISAELKYANAQAQEAGDVLNQFITGTKELTQAANNASKALSQQIVERKLYDEQSTKALQDALNNSADARINCVFDDSVLRFIDSARESAVKATTDGITGNTGSAVRTSSKAP